MTPKTLLGHWWDDSARRQVSNSRRELWVPAGAAAGGGVVVVATGETRYPAAKAQELLLPNTTCRRSLATPSMLQYRSP